MGSHVDVTERRSTVLGLALGAGFTLVLSLSAWAGAIPASVVETLWSLALAILFIGAIIAFAQRSKGREARRSLSAAAAVFAFLAGATALLVLLARALAVDLASPFPWFALSGLSVIAWPLSLRSLGRMGAREAFLLGVALVPITFVLQLGVLFLVSRLSFLG